MFLRTLTLKGFKSFADPTSLVLEPGVTVVVGPNGSGKSNVVDAIAWVLGAQGPRIVRSSKMDDVIFAGTPTRAPLGRAEVSLTIDNSSRRLPVDLGEVTLTRTLFRTGESEYAINGVACRLLDVQELLSDSGVGRQQHVIVSQGQLDSILSARPEDRRAVIEEAAGVLKFRRRRERAERRLESSEGSLARLEDLLREVRRQIRPLERQAAAARRHAELAGEASGIRLYLLGREISALDVQLTDAAQASVAALGRQSEVASDAEALDREITGLQQALALDRPEELDAVLGRCAQLRERARQLATRCDERRRSQSELAAALVTPVALARLEEERRQVDADLAAAEAAAEALSPEWDELAEAERRLVEDEASFGSRFAEADDERNDAPPAESPPLPQLPLAEARREAASARERLGRARESEARLAERLGTQRRQQAELAASSEELGRALESARAAAELAAASSDRLAAEEARAGEAAATAEEAWHLAVAAEQAAGARAEALELALHEARARAGLERLAGLPGVLGTIPDVVEAADGVGLALEAALEGALDAVLVAGGGEVREAVDRLRTGGAGGAVLPLLASSPAAAATAAVTAGRVGIEAPPGTEPLRPLVTSSEPAVDRLLDGLLARVLLCRDGFAQACELALDAAAAGPAAGADWTFVTLDGERLSPQGWRVGAGRSGVTRAALERAAGLHRSTAGVAQQAAGGRVRASAELASARDAAAAARSDASRRAAELVQLEHTAGEVSRRSTELAEQLARTSTDRQATAEAIAAAAEGLAAADERVRAVEEREQLASLRREEASVARRRLEERSRALLVLRSELDVRTAALEERLSQLRRRADELARRLEVERAELAVADDRRSATAAESEVLVALAGAGRQALAELDAHARELAGERARRAGVVEGVLAQLGTLRREREVAEQTHRELQVRLQRLEVEQAEGRVRHEAALSSLRSELGASPQEAFAAPEPACPPGTTLGEHLGRLDTELRGLGPVNPLAAEELTELEERNAFLENQLDDVRAARRDLREVIRGVDAEIVEVFQAAFADVEEHFSRLVATLFPGGEGRLVLTAPDEPLTTGVEIEARPPGRNVRRLSLLSGGERSLVALAFLFAVFRSRPSPFYVMDEVEAALDEVNLLRFLDLVEDFRNEAQLLIVSHQKRTMQVADALYGISMQPGGSSRAVSERLRQPEPVAVMEAP